MYDLIYKKELDLQQLADTFRQIIKSDSASLTV